VTLKLRPSPETSALVRLTFDSLTQIDAVLQRLLTSRTRPVVLDVLSGIATYSRSNAGTGKSAHPTTTQLIVGFEGATHEISWQVETLLAECRPFEPRTAEPFVGVAADSLWDELRDFSINSQSLATFKASLPASRTCEFLRLAAEADIAAQAHAGNGIVIGHLPNRVKTVEQAAELLKPLGVFVTANGGHLSAIRAPSGWTALDTVANSSAASLAWTQRLKRQLDPHNLLDSGAIAIQS
jgi:glycolate oxidase FAD binding subunit